MNNTHVTEKASALLQDTQCISDNPDPYSFTSVIIPCYCFLPVNHSATLYSVSLHLIGFIPLFVHLSPRRLATPLAFLAFRLSLLHLLLVVFVSRGRLSSALSAFRDHDYSSVQTRLANISLLRDTERMILQQARHYLMGSPILPRP